MWNPFGKKQPSDPYRGIPDADRIPPPAPPKVSYPIVLNEFEDIRMIDTGKGVVFERHLSRKDALGNETKAWVNLTEYNDNGKENYHFETAPEWAKSLLKWFFKQARQ